MSRSDLADTTCTTSRAVERVGETWRLMILREMFLGSRRFDDLQRNTGASPHILSQRLKGMVEDGIIRTHTYSHHPPRKEYLLTEKGRDLWPVIVMLRAWGNKWLDKSPERSTTLTHKGCGAVSEPYLVCSACGEPMEAHDCSATIGKRLEEERQNRRGS
ncbi:winged helix-turn-helix transcriptional regulator [Arenibacterium sp. CAU 1754]